MLCLFKCDIQKVTMKYLDINISHLQTVNFWNITPGIIKLSKTTPYIFSTFFVSHQLIYDCQNITHDPK